MGCRTCANPCQRCPDPRGKSNTCPQGEYRQSHPLWLLYLLGFSGQFRTPNSIHSSCDVCSSCIPTLSVDFYLLSQVVEVELLQIFTAVHLWHFCHKAKTLWGL